jgi:ADP-ribosylglycohydrolase
MRFFFGRGMVSDDTEHTLMVAQALLSHPEDTMAFQRSLAWKFRWWFAGLPGGVGLATARACLKLWIGFPASKSGVHSAGSGPPMRSAILGAYFADEPERRRAFVLASSRLTHQGWQAETAALAVAESVALTMLTHRQPDSSEIVAALMRLSPKAEWKGLLTAIEISLKAQHSVSEFACGLGLKRAVSGYSLHVVPLALYAWLRHPGNFRAALISVLECGGDTDTTGAILGALSGVSGGKGSVPSEWLNALWEWPRSRSLVEKIAARLAKQKSSSHARGPVYCFWPGLLLRNLFFFAVVLIHGFRRLLPPY